MNPQKNTDQQLLQDIISWDVYNWSRALDHWQQHGDVDQPRQLCMELGSRCGGLSLWLALKGHEVICTDLHLPAEEAQEVHKKYQTGKLIRYEKADAANITYENTFDIIIFKSTLGGVSAKDNALKQQTLKSIHRALKPGGRLLFAENLEGSALHRFMRRRFVQWGREWNYLKFDELPALFGDYRIVRHETIGFLGTFGRTEKQRKWLGRLDRFVEKLIPRSWRYIVMGVAQK